MDILLKSRWVLIEEFSVESRTTLFALADMAVKDLLEEEFRKIGGDSDSCGRSGCLCSFFRPADFEIHRARKILAIAHVGEWFTYMSSSSGVIRALGKIGMMMTIDVTG